MHSQQHLQDVVFCPKSSLSYCYCYYSPFQLFLFHLNTIPGGNFTQCVTHGSFRAHWEETVYNMFTFTTLYITPLSVMIVCYIRILWEISKQLKVNKGK